MYVEARMTGRLYSLTLPPRPETCALFCLAYLHRYRITAPETETGKEPRVWTRACAYLAYMCV